MTNADELAYPINIIDPEGRFQPEHHSGLTKREYFTAMALQGSVASGFQCSNEKHAQAAIELADALIKALNQTK